MKALTEAKTVTCSYCGTARTLPTLEAARAYRVLPKDQQRPLHRACVKAARAARLAADPQLVSGNGAYLTEDGRLANHIDGYDRDDLGESGDY